MVLSPNFQFSQASLQDYVDCPRRFYLRYALRLAWPAIEAAPALEHERRLRAGLTFHAMVQQHLVGIPAERLTRLAAADPDLARWWEHYLESRPADLPGRRYPELTLSAPLGGYRLIAKYDLVVVSPEGELRILDWKTSRKRTSSRWLAERMQTRVYRYLLVRAGGHLTEGAEVLPERVRMTYWFAEFPHEPEQLPYGEALYLSDEEYVEGLVATIRGSREEDFALTEEERRCRYCAYRSLCNRGKEAGLIGEREEEVDVEDLGNFDLDFDQVAELEF